MGAEGNSYKRGVREKSFYIPEPPPGGAAERSREEVVLAGTNLKGRDFAVVLSCF